MKAKGKIDPNIIEKLGMGNTSITTGPGSKFAKESLRSNSPED